MDKDVVEGGVTQAKCSTIVFMIIQSNKWCRKRDLEWYQQQNKRDAIIGSSAQYACQLIRMLIKSKKLRCKQTNTKGKKIGKGES